MAGGMKNVVEMGPLPQRNPNSAVNAIMNRRHSGMFRDAEENLKMIMLPNKVADYPALNDPFALLDNGVAATSGPSINLELENFYLYKWIPKFDPNMDPKYLRVISSRLAALKSRVRKSEYIAQLEQEVDSLKAIVSVMANQVSYYDCKCIELYNENEAIRKSIDELYGELKLKNAETEWLKQEKRRLSDILIMQHQLQQQLQLVPPEPNHDQEQQEIIAECNLGEEQEL
ncbi:hypothetical protein NE237_004359 [Protea cynaroides]|uniref:BZIP domain-containing protein n=1 Tax=Protea cynaroides TaxID=273540 RepID=A0A9Q0QTA0_9MAGN|nr:hypothetical protein NE237_004359 [Protea cynaroides]